MKRPRCTRALDAALAAEDATHTTDPPLAPTHESHFVPTTASAASAAVSSKRFKKVGGRGPGALVRIKMETVQTGRENARGAEEAAEEAPQEDIDEEFEQAVQHGRATSTRRRR